MLSRYIDFWYQSIEKIWENRYFRRFTLSIIIATFFVLMLFIYGRSFFEWLPPYILEKVPNSSFGAITMVFNLILIIESLSLIFTIPRSVSDSIREQLQILSLILLRNIFKVLAETSDWTHLENATIPILINAVSAAAIFFILLYFTKYRVHSHILVEDENKQTFSVIKKSLSILLFFGSLLLIISNLVAFFQHNHILPFFATYYNLLIYCDVLIVLFSFYYSHNYYWAFRNSAFVVVTILVRIAVLAPHNHGGPIGVAAAVYALIIALAFKKTRDMNQLVN